MRDISGPPDGVGRPLSASVTPWDAESKPGLDLAPGTRIKQYELIREIGRGGMGVVYVARDVVLGRRVAMKFLSMVGREIIDRFLVEARATAQCSHDNIVIIYEVDEFQGMPYMVLEFLEGKTLRDYMGPWGESVALAPSRVVELMLPVARGLARAHELGVVHRDLKPDNIMVTSSGQVKVLDFGIAKALGHQDPSRPQLSLVSDARSLSLTREGALVGTLPYMSPEHLGQDVVDHRSDLFSLGMIMFEMLAGAHAVQPLTAEAVLQVLSSEYPLRSVRTAAPHAPDALADIVDACLVKTKGQRLPSAAALATHLENLLPGRSGRALAEGESPFPGLTAFQEADADRFFGRARDVARMVARIRERPLTGVVGPSGVGKSSFVRAGVGPALKASGETWDVITIRPGRYPLRSLASVIERPGPTTGRSPITSPVTSPITSAGTTPGTSRGEHGTGQTIQRLRREPGALGVHLRERALARGTSILLFVDQFEELYTLVSDAEERHAFTAALAAVADDAAAPLRVVVSMRSDFLDRVGEDAAFLDELARGLVFLAPPDREGLREALEQPVEMVGYRFETQAMVGEMLDALADTPGALPLLQFAAAKLWDARDRQRRLLTAASYAGIGGISGALATHADEVVGNLGASAQQLAQRIFRQLVTPERTRAIVELSDLHALAPGEGEIERVIEQLVAARLLVVQKRGDGTGGSVEIVHESLIDRWPTLRRWLDDGQEDAALLASLATSAKQWDSKGRPTGLLWRGDALDEARRWYTAQPRTLAAREHDFLDAALSLARRGTRTRRTIMIAAFVALGAVAAGAMVALVKVRAAEEHARANATRAMENEATVTKQLADVQAATAARDQAAREAAAAADAAKLAETQSAALQGDLAQSKEELAAQNEKLRAEAAKTTAALAQVDAERKKALANNAVLEQGQALLKQKLAAEQQRIKELEKLSTRLK